MRIIAPGLKIVSVIRDFVIPKPLTKGLYRDNPKIIIFIVILESPLCVQRAGVTGLKHPCPIELLAECSRMTNKSMCQPFYAGQVVDLSLDLLTS